MAELAHRPLSWFKINPQLRKRFDESDLRSLGESLRIKQLQPVLAKADGALIAGERRDRAAKLVGLAELQVILTEANLSDSEIKIIQLTENVHRADLTGFEKWQACEELLRLNAWKPKDLADHLKVEPATITKWLSPGKCIPAIQEALAAGALGLSHSYEMSLCSTQEQHRLLELRLGGASRDAITLERQRPRNGNAKPAARRASRVSFPLPLSGARVVITGKSLSFEQVIDILAESLKEAKKGRETARELRTWVAVMKSRAKAEMQPASRS